MTQFNNLKELHNKENYKKYLEEDGISIKTISKPTNIDVIFELLNDSMNKINIMKLFPEEIKKLEDLKKYISEFFFKDGLHTKNYNIKAVNNLRFSSETRNLEEFQKALELYNNLIKRV